MKVPSTKRSTIKSTDKFTLSLAYFKHLPEQKMYNQLQTPKKKSNLPEKRRK